jgi:hypothetical protein
MMIQSYAAKMGRQVTPAEAHYIASIQPEAMIHTTQMAQNGDPTALANIKALYGGNPVEMLSAKSKIVQANAEANKAVDEATMTSEKVPYAAGNAMRDAQSKALAIAREIRASDQPPTPTQLDLLATGGQVAWEVPVAGVPGAKRWMTGPKDQVPPGVTPLDSTKYHAEEGKRKAADALAKEQATTTAATRTMKETAPHVIELANALEKDLKGITAGPLASRWQTLATTKAGAANPQWKQFQTDATLLSSLVARMHVGARGSEYISKKFDDMIGASFQSPENVQSTIDVIRRYSNIIQDKPEGETVDYPAEALGTGGQSTSPEAGTTSAADFLAQP